MAYSSITKPSLHFNTKLYSGTGSSNAITGIGFQPDFVWIKKRNGTTQHALFDALRGTGKYLESSSTAPDQTDNNSLSTFGTDGFTVVSKNSVNTNGDTYVSWNWKANGAGSANTDGSINTVSTSVNTTAGFSISKFTGTGSAATVGHGLGAVPKMYIVKNITTNSLQWRVYHASLGATKNMALDATQAVGTASSVFNDTEPTSSVFSVGTDDAANKSGNSLIAYCFAEKTGYSKFGSYVGNGNADGTFVYTGFKPAFVMTKAYSGSSATSAWSIVDTKRANSYNPQQRLFPNTSDAESATGVFDLLSNGFKLVSGATTNNASSTNYIYMAFAEEPLVANVGASIPATAR